MLLRGQCAFLVISNLLIGRLSCAAFIGLQLRVSFASLRRLRCSPCYDDSLQSQTTTANISSCSGPYLFVGVKCLESDTFVIGAYAPAKEILSETAVNAPYLYNGVYWYYSAGRYLGFSDAADLDQLLADGYSSMSSNHQMLWSIDEANVLHAVVNATSWKLRKAIYSCPEGALILAHYVAESYQTRLIQLLDIF